MNRITVNASLTYDVLMEKGLLDQSGEIAKEVTGVCKACIISDKTVHDLYMERVADSFDRAGFSVRKVVFPPGEESKSLKSLSTLLEYLAEEEFTRSDILVALGGGIIGDLTGFAAAVYQRGIRCIQMPTTLLAAVDASIGGKTAVNLKAGKNLAGAFWQPSAVLYDPATASSLTEDVFLDGLAEVIKSGAISDNDLFTYVARGEEPDRDVFVHNCVEHSIKVKKELVEKDEHDTGLRQLLNFGHTSAHAIEKCSDFSISHGHAVAIGMLISAKASQKFGWSRYDCSIPIRNVLNKYHYPLRCDFTAEQLTEASLRDKKRRGNMMTLVIPLKIGECALMDVPVDVLHDFFSAGLEGLNEAK